MGKREIMKRVHVGKKNNKRGNTSDLAEYHLVLHVFMKSNYLL